MRPPPLPTNSNLLLPTLLFFPSNKARVGARSNVTRGTAKNVLKHNPEIWSLLPVLCYHHQHANINLLMTTAHPLNQADLLQVTLPKAITLLPRIFVRATSHRFYDVNARSTRSNPNIQRGTGPYLRGSVFRCRWSNPTSHSTRCVQRHVPSILIQERGFSR